jgi:hypothetical protein
MVMLRRWLALGFGLVVAAVTLTAGYQWAASLATYCAAMIELLA